MKDEGGRDQLVMTLALRTTYRTRSTLLIFILRFIL